MELQGKNALITGASKRIGKEIALFLAEKGANIIIHYNRSEDEAEKVRALAEDYGVKAIKIRADLEKEEDINFIIKESLLMFRKIDILVNNASVYYKTPLDDLSMESLDRFYSVHIKAPLFISKSLGKIMFENGYGRIINIIDYAPLRPYRDYSAYIVTKGGLYTMTKVLAKELAPHVLVNGILPGPIIPAEGTEDIEVPLEKTVLKKWGGEKEICKAVEYLIKTEFTTGSFIPVEGGRLIC
ncbi:MAG TPA: KR domain-containing protein [Persephonella sp.]|uniref:Oxidoreductase, short-chain dehydrogenase/reductase family n=1 Tax=Persephonella marina (strain DSM 14350 / EX-H1) TaxID=123214 RepID=C0QQ06_PERMH|nr:MULTISPECIES: SDR family NAD(P)-dependent oxidoreductase [Persephonella]ACO04610.1 oxidoreductase, short-chain dehydrogenase/reductase family [Persephonella marina EX-H1]HCB69633.1 KR domain-containing protein [Persephonella sp.]